ncbi:MAG: TIGR04083 family peptide-modifying radical SAM enzyme [bacterium]|nr:TIGR04083 family peptide-modifying radical SAM enzyme [bacterium]
MMSTLGMPEIMLCPSRACPASCVYCFGPNRGPVMSKQILKNTLGFVERMRQDIPAGRLSVLFHGGEPLMASHDFFARALDGLSALRGKGAASFSLQSNLWRLDEEFCRLFGAHKVSLGGSLDGPEELNDRQRGEGYFRRFMSSVELARASGLNVGCIATFTPRSARHRHDVFEFFLERRLDFTVHASVPGLGVDKPQYALRPAQYADLFEDLVAAYLPERRRIAISAIDQMARGIVEQRGQVCSFKDCLGLFTAVDAEGYIYPCQRFCGHENYRMGNVAERPRMESLLQSPVARCMKEREERVSEACGDCAHYPYCKGGCFYNAEVAGTLVDPYCAAYKRIFDGLNARLQEEMVAEANQKAVLDEAWDGESHPVLRRGPLIDIAATSPHPSVLAGTAIRVVSAVAVAAHDTDEDASEELDHLGLDTSVERMAAFRAKLREQVHGLNNLYIHATFNCPQRCNHCYACAEEGEGRFMRVDDITSLARQAADAGFRQVILTGGEPLLHPDREGLFVALAGGRKELDSVNLVLRTNFALPLEDEEHLLMANAFDQIVASVDGDRASRESGRGAGSCDATVENIRLYQKHHADQPGAAELSIACVMSAEAIKGEPGQSVRELARELRIGRVRFRSLLPLGRAKHWRQPPVSEAIAAHESPESVLRNGFSPVNACGLGRSLYIEPSGEAFPCHAYHEPHSRLGNAIASGIGALLGREAFVDQATHCVDTNSKCRACRVRYLCGGACRAWGGEATQYDQDAPPLECEDLRQRAESLYEAALRQLK